MPSKKKFKGKSQKKKVDSKQNSRIKVLEDFIFKTVENKQTEVVSTNNNASTTPTYYYNFAAVTTQGTQDTANQNAGTLAARIGNTITMMNEKISLVFTPPPTGGITETYNRIRVLLVQPLDGNQNLVLSDILKYHNYALHGDMVFGSPYTTKSATNSRYKIRFDKTFELAYNGGNNNTKIIKHTIKHGKSGRVISFNDGAQQPVDYSLNLIVISDSGAVGHPQWNFSYRGTYKDA